MAKVTFTVEDPATFATPLDTTADISPMTIAQVIVAYRAIDPAAYATIDTGQVDHDGKPVMHTLTDSETINKIAGVVLQGILDNVTRYQHQQALAAVQPSAPASFTVL